MVATPDERQHCALCGTKDGATLCIFHGLGSGDLYLGTPAFAGRSIRPCMDAIQPAGDDTLSYVE